MSIDCVEYWMHRLGHANKLYWKFHCIHHTPEQLTPLSKFRIHWVDMTVFGTVKAVPLLMLGHLDDMWMPYLPLMILQVFSHFDIDFHYGPILGRFLVSPRYHRVHHSADPAQQNTNFGIIFSCWDYIFGTAAADLTRPGPSALREVKVPDSSRSSSSSRSCWWCAASAGAAAPRPARRSQPCPERRLMAANQAKLQAFLARALYDLGAAQSAALVATRRPAGPLPRDGGGADRSTPRGARGAHRHERGLPARVAGQPGLRRATSSTTPRRGTFTLPEEHALALAREDDPRLRGRRVPGRGRAGERAGRRSPTPSAAAAACRARPTPPSWREATGARRARALRRGHCSGAWLDAMPGMTARLEAGASVADVGCGEGAVVLALARAFPRSRFAGLRRPRPLGRGGAGARSGERPRRLGAVRGRRGRGPSRRRLRPRDLLREPARDGRSRAGGAAACARRWPRTARG